MEAEGDLAADNVGRNAIGPRAHLHRHNYTAGQYQFATTRKRQMEKIKFSREETKALVGEIQDYFREELDQDIGAIPAELLMQFFADKMGAYFYNRGLYDAQALVRKQVDALSDDIFGLEQPTRHLR